MVRILLYITSLINLAQIVFYGYLSAINDDYDGMFLLFIAIIAGILVQIGLYVHYKYLQNNIQTPSKPNGEQPGALGRILGIGVLFIGRWRKYAETYVGYTFFIFLVPLFPTGCYRYRIVKSEVNSITYNIYGSEKWSGKELFCIYTYFYGGIVWFMSLFMQIIFNI